MRIVIANPYFPPYAPGGAEHSLEQMCQRFVKQECAVHVVTNCYDGNPRVEEREGYIVNFVYSPIRLSPGQQIDASQYLNSKQYYQSLIEALIRSLPNDSSGTVFIANNAQCFIPVEKAGKITGVPTIGIVRDTQVICETGACIDSKLAEDAIPCKGLIGSAKCMLQFHRVRGYQGVRAVPGILLNGVATGMRRERLRHNGLRALDQVVTISDALQCLIRKLPNMRNHKITTIRNFYTDIDKSPDEEVLAYLERYGLRDKSYFLIAGKKSYGKGSDLAVEAIRIVRRKHPNIGLLFVGKGTAQSSNHISYVDNPSVPQSLLLSLLYHSVALLIPGRWQEGLHRTMIDALHMGLPIICSEAGGPKEAVNDVVNGYVVVCDKPEALAESMCNVCKWDEERLKKCREASMQIFKEMFSDDKLMKKWRHLFGEL